MRRARCYSGGMTDFQKGQTVTFAERHTAQRASGYGDSKNFARGDTAVVTAVRKDTITVKVDNPLYGTTTGTGWNVVHHTAKTHSYNVPRENLVAPNGEVWTPAVKPVARKLGTVPEGGISPSDPGLAWFWEDAQKLANRLGYCSTYDDIAEKLGAPGRKRSFYVNAKINGLDVSTNVEAHSQKEAEAIVREKLASAPTT